MNVVGLVTEYNPFHNGHLYHIEEAKRITGADYVIVVMSGNFVQRGTPAIIDKYRRAEMALGSGADVVFELPVCYATASAEFFALGAVSLLDKLGVVNSLCFGSECGDTRALMSIAKVLLNEPAEFKNKLNSCMKAGTTYPVARMEALKTVIPDLDESVISSPNNILGIEYCKALLRLSSNIQPVTISRKTAGYHTPDLTTVSKETISSATAIRKVLQEAFYSKKEASVSKDVLEPMRYHVPEHVCSILGAAYNTTFPITEDDFSLLLNYKLLQETAQSLTSYTDVTPDLSNRINGISTAGLTFQQLAQNIKSRQWTLTRVNRVLIHILLNLKSSNFNSYNKEGYCQYARLLGFRKSSSRTLREIAAKNTIPLITKMADAGQILTDKGKAMLQEDISAAQLYNHVIYNKFGTLLKDEYTNGVVML